MELKKTVGGLTWRAFFALGFSMLVMGMAVQWFEVILCYGGAPAERALPIPALMVMLFLLVMASLWFALTKSKILTRAEMLCVTYAMLVATPMMTQGMWHRFFGLIAGTPREGNFNFIDAYSDKLWPHGRNLLQGAWTEERFAEGTVSGTVEWREEEVENSRKPAMLPAFRNEAVGAVSSVRLAIPNEKGALKPGEAYLVCVLAKAEGMTPDSSYYVRLIETSPARDGTLITQGETLGTEWVTDRSNAAVTFVHQKGFRRIGSYGVVLPPSAVEGIVVEFGLKGPGEVVMADPRLMDVSALDRVYSGVKLVSRTEYEALPEGERGGLLVKPDSWWSLAGVKFLVSGYIPLKDWGQTAVAWSVPLLLLLAGLFALAVVVRKQWAENERYPMPIARIPTMLIGEPDEEGETPWGRVWKLPIFWGGAAFGLVWGLLKMWAFYNPAVPDLSINIPLNQYLDDPGWGGMWNVNFSVTALMVAVCIFFELNVLLSFVLGMFVFRSLYWVGEFSGMKAYSGYPFPYEHAIGAYVAYVAVALFFMRKYLWKVIRAAFSSRNREASSGEVMSYRTAILLFLATFAGLGLWAQWLGVPTKSVLIFFAFLTIIGFASMKMYSECGIPAGYFSPYNAMLVVALLGGMRMFGADGVLLCLLLSGFLTVSVFFLTPGAQFDFLEYSRRYGIRRRDVLLTVLLGALGGLFVGGWVFLSNAYALGGVTIRYQWAFNQSWFFGSYKAQLAQETAALLRSSAGAEAASGVPPATWAYVFGGVVTAILCVIRQFFAGFWFHPIGFVLGSSHMAGGLWGSALAAWIIRATVLK
ncbi:MAG: hypothetical protein FWF84_05860, partial [Kiritimatiellaeota bacterium]|nr:hypothetical protein [Kiritimatiellota bacterium]